MKLNQILSIEKGIKSRAYAELSDLHKTCQKPALFNGFTKSYVRKSEDDDEYPQESQQIQVRAGDAIAYMRELLVPLFDVVASKDAANTVAAADIVVDGHVLAAGVPATTILFLEKQINDIRSFIEAMPVLDPAERWQFDEVSGQYYTNPTQTQRTKKVARPIVLYPATEQHPAQTQLISEDVVVGHWDMVKVSSAMVRSEKTEILARINALSSAVKQAREEANLVAAPDTKIGDKILSYVVSGQT